MTTPPREPPPGCLEIPGICVEAGRQGTWLTQDGKRWTMDRSERGIWKTNESALAAAEKAPTTE